MASTRPGSVFTTSAPGASRLRHRREELLVVLRASHALEQELDRFGLGHVAQEVPEQIDPIELFLREQELLLARSRALNVDRWKDATIRDFSVEHELHVASSLELLEDHFVHSRTGLNERRRNDRQRS